MFEPRYDIIVVGAGHAGAEAALAGQRLGQKVLVVTSNISRIAFMSCNPSIGGLGKGHIVKEVDVLGGQMPLAADHSTIQFKRLNQSKGPAVRGSRSQCDKDQYSNYMSEHLRSKVQVVESEVKSLIVTSGVCSGVVLGDGTKVHSQSVILTTGTFMGAVMHFGQGEAKKSGGRDGDKASLGLSDNLRELGFEVTRLKTGTPPRLLKQSIDWSKLTAHYGDEHFFPFSHRHTQVRPKLEQVACYQTYTNEKTHEIIRENLSKSSMYSGELQSAGPRYCPSIEDKVVRFAEKNRHLTFLEPETLNGSSIYLQGISTCLPESIQYELLKTLPGLENVKILKPGYAVEYDFMNPHQIRQSLETKQVENLYFAGQINGTSGYEEAACQGLMAGANAAFKNTGQASFSLGRDEAYTGVLIDDLVVKGTKEPYRMLTSRAEHRLILREDNVLSTLLEKSWGRGLISEKDYEFMNLRLEAQKKLHNQLETIKVKTSPKPQAALKEIGTPLLQKPAFAKELLRRKEVNFDKIFKLKELLGWDELEDPRNLEASFLEGLSPEDKALWFERFVFEPVSIQIKYEGYISRQESFLKQARRVNQILIPKDIQWDKVHGLSLEDREKILAVCPSNFGQIERISGVTPSAIQSLLIHLKIRGKSAQSPASAQ